MTSLLDHLWQSTLCAAAVALLVLVLRNNRAAVRHWLWWAASVKFLLPFSLLVTAGTWLSRLAAVSLQPEMAHAVTAISQPFVPAGVFFGPAPSPSGVADATPLWLLIVSLVVWSCGCSVVLGRCWRAWRNVARNLALSTPAGSGLEWESLRRMEAAMHVERQIPFLVSDSSIEPGVIGIFKPTLVWPRRLTDRLSSRQVDAIMAHEISHVRRHDNLLVSVHMLVEAMFWFYPVVWWLRSRLIEERESACDEDVIRHGNEPEVTPPAF